TAVRMTVYLALLLAGALLGLLFTPLVSSTSRALGLVDAPGGRKVHSASVPRDGGLAICLAAALALAGVVSILRAQQVDTPSFAPLRPVLLGAALVFTVGLVDDFAPLPPWPKLA